MVLDFYRADQKEIEITDLIKEGQRIDGYTEKYGWDHECLVRLLRNHGLASYRQEFKSLEIDSLTGGVSTSDFANKLGDFGCKKIRQQIESGQPVLVSVLKRFAEPNTFHMVLVVGFETSEDRIKGFYCDDPEAKDASIGQNIFVPLEDFMSAWRLLAIFVDKIENNLIK
jgi:hypothetical protein